MSVLHLLGTAGEGGAETYFVDLLKALNRAHLLAPDALYLSARSGKNLDQLIGRCLEQIADAVDSGDLLVPHSRYDVISKLHATGHVQNQEERDNGVFLQGRFPATQAGLFTPFIVVKKK